MKISLPRRSSSKSEIRTHYAVRLLFSVRHMGESVWQPLCKISNVSKISLTTRLSKITCINCRNQLIKGKRRLGIGRQINKLLREGKWRHDSK